MLRLAPRPLVAGLFLVVLAAIATFNTQAWAQGMASVESLAGQSAQTKQIDSKQLATSLDDVIQTLENEDERRALLAQLKQLKQTTQAEADQNRTSVTTSGGLLGALADSFSDLSSKSASGDSPTAVWQAHASDAAAEAGALIAQTERRELARNLSAIALAF